MVSRESLERCRRMVSGESPEQGIVAKWPSPSWGVGVDSNHRT